MRQTHRTWVWPDRLVVRQRLVHVSQVFKVVVFEDLAGGHAVAIIVDEQFGNDLCGLGTHVRNKFGNARPFLWLKVKLHVTGLSLKLGKQFWCWRPQDVVDLVHLIQLVVAWEKRKEGEDFEVHAAYAPIVHLVVVVPVRQQTLRRAVPSRADVLCEGWLRVDTSARPEIGQFDLILLQKDVFSAAIRKLAFELINHLRLDVAMKNAVAVHVVNCFEHLVHVVLDPLFG